jgi:phosphoribosyl 1,2-cyclic phosphodiesterase
MRLAVLGSGSSGNAVLIESAGRQLLIDAGFPWRELKHRMEKIAADPSRLAALVVTHEHHDHVRGAEVMLRRTGLPCFATAGTLEGMALPDELAPQARQIKSGRVTEFGCFRLEPFAISHDAREPIGLVIEDEAGFRVGLVADLGVRTQLAWTRLRRLDALILETNHDLHMLRTGPYSWALKQRIAGRLGHLSNEDAAVGLAELLDDRLQMVLLYHLSRTNNTALLATEAVGARLDALGSAVPLVATSQDEPTSWIELAAPRGVQQRLFAETSAW